MMGMILAALGPASLSMKIRIQRGQMEEKCFLAFIMQYFCEMIKITFLTVIIIIYVFKIKDVQFSALESFSFFIKYSLISLVWALAVPYIEELIHDYIKISFAVENRNEEKEK